MTAAHDLEQLARCGPALYACASPLLRIPGGQSEGAPAERVQPMLATARAAMGRLAAMRDAHYPECLALLASYLEGHHTEARWHETLALLVSAPDRRRKAIAKLLSTRPGSGPDAKSLTTEGEALLTRANGLYDEASPTHDIGDGAWLGRDCESVRNELREVARLRRSVACELLAKRKAPARDAQVIDVEQMAREHDERVAAERAERAEYRAYRTERAERLEREAKGRETAREEQLERAREANKP